MGLETCFNNTSSFLRYIKNGVSFSFYLQFSDKSEKPEQNRFNGSKPEQTVSMRPTYKRAGDKIDLYKRAGDKFDLSKHAGDKFDLSKRAV